jgi:CheY-like chemotaxis protein
MDLALPVMDGWEARAGSRPTPRTAAIPVVALTGHAMADTSDGVEKAGCDAYVVKPCLPEDLVKAISEILESALQFDPDLPPV